MSVNRHDILIAFDVTNGNPNGDPDAGNLPRMEPNSGKGLVSDVCLKRKVRNFVSLFPPTPATDNQFGILVQQGNILNNEIKKGIEKSTTQPRVTEEAKKQIKDLKEKIKALKADIKREQDAEKKKQLEEELKVIQTKLEPLEGGPTDQERAQDAMKYLCKTFFDVRTFGGVLSTGDDVLKGSAYGQVRGPVQFTLGMSVDPITTQEITVTRCAVTKEEDAAKERTMGHKHIVPYGLYVAKAFVSPMFADKTGFDAADLKVFFEALTHLFGSDQSAARAEMCVRAVFAFEHVGTQGEKNEKQNRREQQLGCAHAHKLFESVTIKRNGNSTTTFPTAFTDYDVTVDGWEGNGKNSKFPGVVLHRLV